MRYTTATAISINLGYFSYVAGAACRSMRGAPRPPVCASDQCLPLPDRHHPADARPLLPHNSTANNHIAYPPSSPSPQATTPHRNQSPLLRVEATPLHANRFSNLRRYLRLCLLSLGCCIGQVFSFLTALIVLLTCQTVSSSFVAE